MSINLCSNLIVDGDINADNLHALYKIESGEIVLSNQGNYNCISNNTECGIKIGTIISNVFNEDFTISRYNNNIVSSLPININLKYSNGINNALTISNIGNFSNLTKSIGITYIGSDSISNPKNVFSIVSQPKDNQYCCGCIEFSNICNNTLTKMMTLNYDNKLDVSSNSGSGGYISSGNYAGTGCAAYFPYGIYSLGTNWIYGTTVLGNSTCSSSGCWWICGVNGNACFKGTIYGNITNATTAINSNTSICLCSIDNRDIVTTPETMIAPGLKVEFKSNTTECLCDGGDYFGEISLRPYGYYDTDWSGGPAHQLGFTTNGNIYHRYGTGILWNNWKYLINSNNISGQTVKNSICANGLIVNNVNNDISNSIVRTDSSGIICGKYFSSNLGNEGNNINPNRVWGTNGSDNIMRSYNINYLCVYSASTSNISNNSTNSEYSKKLWSCDYSNTYYLYHCWNGSYWCIVTNHTNGIAVCKSDISNNSTCLNGQLANYYAISSHVHGCITNSGNIGTISGCVLCTGTNGCIGVTSSVANSNNSTCLNGQLGSYYAISSHVHGCINNCGCIGTTSGCILCTGTNGCITVSSNVTCSINSTNSVNSTCLNGQLSSYYATCSQINALNLTNNYILKWNGSSLCNSSIYDNGICVGIGTNTPLYKLDINGITRIQNIQTSTSNSILVEESGVIKKNNINNIGLGSFVRLSGDIMTGGLTGTTATFSGLLSASVKSFIIDHPTISNKKLQYGVLEGPEHAVYYRGYSKSNEIILPEEWKGLVREETITVNITSNKYFNLYYIKSININKIKIMSLFKPNFYYTIYGERKDIDKLITVI